MTRLGRLFNGVLQQGGGNTIEYTETQQQIAEMQQKITTLETCCSKVQGLIIALKPTNAIKSSTVLNASPIWGDYYTMNLYNESLLIGKIEIISVIRSSQTPQQQIQVIRNGAVLGYLWIPNINLDYFNSRVEFTASSVKLQAQNGTGSTVTWVNDPSVAYYNVNIDYTKPIQTI